MPLGDVDLDLGCINTLTNLDELFREVQLREVLKRLVLLLEYNWRRKQECKVDLLLENARHFTNFEQLCLVLLQNSNDSIDLTGLLLVLIVQETLLSH